MAYTHPKSYKMAKRFFDTKIWDDDWFLDMPNEYKLFWFYMLSSCDSAGIFKVNLRSFSGLLGVKISAEEILKIFNTGKERILPVSEKVWVILDFFSFQYGHSFNINNPFHKGVKKILDKQNISINTLRGLKEVNLTPKRGLLGVSETIKEKEKEIYIDLDSSDNRKVPKVGKGAIEFSGIVCYDAEQEILKNQIWLEQQQQKFGKSDEELRESLRKFHLHLAEKEQYPKGRKAIFAGFEKWLMNEKNFVKQSPARKSPLETELEKARRNYKISGK